MADLFTYGHTKDIAVPDPVARTKYWSDIADAFLLTDKICEKCSGKMQWIGVQTLGMLKYQCIDCYTVFVLQE
jgi:hypothetical protein